MGGPELQCEKQFRIPDGEDLKNLAHPNNSLTKRISIVSRNIIPVTKLSTTKMKQTSEKIRLKRMIPNFAFDTHF